MNRLALGSAVCLALVGCGGAPFSVAESYGGDGSPPASETSMGDAGPASMPEAATTMDSGTLPDSGASSAPDAGTVEASAPDTSVDAQPPALSDCPVPTILGTWDVGASMYLVSMTAGQVCWTGPSGQGVCATPAILYTNDGSDPTASTGEVYTAPIQSGPKEVFRAMSAAMGPLANGTEGPVCVPSKIAAFGPIPCDAGSWPPSLACP